MRGSKIDPDVLARAVVEAAEIGDAKAAKKHGVGVRTIRRARERVATGDTKLAEACREKVAVVDHNWRAARVRALRAVMARIAELAPNETDLDKLSRSAKNLGEVDMTSAALQIDARPDPESPAPTAPAGGTSGEPANGAHVVQ